MGQDRGVSRSDQTSALIIYAPLLILHGSWTWRTLSESAVRKIYIAVAKLMYLSGRFLCTVLASIMLSAAWLCTGRAVKVGHIMPPGDRMLGRRNNSGGSPSRPDTILEPLYVGSSVAPARLRAALTIAPALSFQAACMHPSGLTTVSAGPGQSWIKLNAILCFHPSKAET